MIIECGLTEEEELYLDKMIEKIESQGYKIHIVYHQNSVRKGAHRS